MPTTYNNCLDYKPTQYDVLVGGANGTISNVGPGTSGQALLSAGNASNPAYSTATYPATSGPSANILVSDGTNWQSSYPGMQYITTITASTSSSISFTSTYITSAYRTYKIILNNIVPSVSSSTIACRMSVDNGSNYLTSGYKSGAVNRQYNNSGSTNTSSTTYIYLAYAMDNTASLGLCGDVNFYGLPATGIKYVSGTTVGIRGAIPYIFQLEADQTGTTPVNNLEFYASPTGTLSTGSISLYGIF